MNFLKLILTGSDCNFATEWVSNSGAAPNAMHILLLYKIPSTQITFAMIHNDQFRTSIVRSIIEASLP